MAQQSLYDQRGVSASKSEVHDAIQHLDKGIFPNAFCKVLPDIAGADPDFCNIMHADTAGTKTSLAYLYWRETGDLSVWKGIAQDAIVMNLDDMACVGCCDNIILSSTIGRNKHLISGEVISALIQATTDIIDNLGKYGIGIHLAGGETADVGDIVRTVDVGYTAFARMKRSEIIECQIRPGDVIVGLASFGQATYEAEYNGGMGSNGLTSARHDIFHKVYAGKYPESFDPNTSADVVYTGSRRLTDPVDVSGKQITAGKLALSPTRSYLPVLMPLVTEHRDKIHGLIHCTGGGQSKVVKFLHGAKAVKNNLFEPPPLFNMIREESGADWKEMYQVFNMGHRMEVYLAEKDAHLVMDIAGKMGVEARVVGHVEAAEQASVVVSGPFGEFSFF
ncbi:MAG TPA: AIR synthase-related protein [Flavilitoribacter sp.]|nr:AIR synthase-related protein [Flavilitoribacter sp.]HMQ90860.1 AIR synthase-related protein [Flavilitoribacter sp.]